MNRKFKRRAFIWINIYKSLLSLLINLMHPCYIKVLKQLNKTYRISIFFCDFACKNCAIGVTGVVFKWPDCVSTFMWNVFVRTWSSCRSVRAGTGCLESITAGRQQWTTAPSSSYQLNTNTHRSLSSSHGMSTFKRGDTVTHHITEASLSATAKRKEEQPSKGM